MAGTGGPNTPIAQEIRDLALDIWHLEAGRSPRRTSKLLLEEHGYEVSPHVIANWSHRDDWHGIANARQGNYAPGMRAETLGNIIISGLHASRNLIGMQSDIAQGKNPAMAAVKAVIDTLHTAGFSPVGRINPVDSNTTSIEDRNRIIDAYSNDEEIQWIIRQHAILEEQRSRSNTNVENLALPDTVEF